MHFVGCCIKHELFSYSNWIFSVKMKQFNVSRIFGACFSFDVVLHIEQTYITREKMLFICMIQLKLIYRSNHGNSPNNVQEKRREKESQRMSEDEICEMSTKSRMFNSLGLNSIKNFLFRL